MSRRFILTIDEDDHGDLFVTLPDELTEELDGHWGYTTIPS